MGSCGKSYKFSIFVALSGRLKHTGGSIKVIKLVCIENDTNTHEKKLIRIDFLYYIRWLKISTNHQREFDWGQIFLGKFFFWTSLKKTVNQKFTNEERRMTSRYQTKMTSRYQRKITSRYKRKITSRSQRKRITKTWYKLYIFTVIDKLSQVSLVIP